MRRGSEEMDLCSFMLGLMKQGQCRNMIGWGIRKTCMINWSRLSKVCLLGFFKGPFVFRDNHASFPWVQEGTSHIGVYDFQGGAMEGEHQSDSCNFCFLKLPSGENVQQQGAIFWVSSPEPHQGQSVSFCCCLIIECLEKSLPVTL